LKRRVASQPLLKAHQREDSQQAGLEDHLTKVEAVEDNCTANKKMYTKQRYTTSPYLLLLCDASCACSKGRELA
jgi:hypothetical protein